MPRDLSFESDEDTLSGMAPLTKEPDTGAPPIMGHVEGVDEMQNNHTNDPGDKLMRDMQTDSKRNELHPFVQTLTLSNLDSCLQLENATFPPNEAASKEKFIYRLTVCGELSLGLFTTTQAVDNSSNADLLSGPTASSAHPADSNEPDRRELLLGHIVATKTTNTTIHEDDMAVPPNWASSPPSAHHEVGHKEHGRTVALHSLAVLPNYQRQGLGKVLLKSYVQRIETAGVADRIALLAHEGLIPFYEKLGFVNRGKSSVSYGGGGWIDMVLEFKKPTEEDTSSKT